MPTKSFTYRIILTIILGIIGAVILSSIFYMQYQEQETQTANTQQHEKKTPPPKPLQSHQIQPKQIPDIIVIKPSFDTVRVSSHGDVVIAGRAMKNKLLTIYLDNKQFAQFDSSDNGEWVYLPEQRLKPGQYQLSLSMQDDNTQEIFADDVILLVVPDIKPEEINTADSDQPIDEQIETSNNILNNNDPIDNINQASQKAVAIKLTNSGEGTPEILSQETHDKKTENQYLTLDSIGYDVNHHVFLTGKSKAGRLNISLSNNIQETINIISNDGKMVNWQHTITQDIAPALYILKLTLYDDKNNIIANYNSNFRHEQKPKNAQDTIVIVQPRNNLWRIAREKLGDGIKYHIIFEANRKKINDPNLIYPGQIFTIPEK